MQSATSRVLVAMVVASLSAETLAVDVSAVALLGEGNLAERFVREETLSVSGEMPEVVLIGTEKSGVVQISSFERTPQGIKVTFLPTTYDEPTSIWVKPKGGSGATLAKTIDLKNPTPPFFSELAAMRAKGRFSAPHLLLTAAIPLVKLEKYGFPERDEAQTTLAVIIVVNRHGEIVWMHNIAGGTRRAHSHVLAKPVGEDLIGLLVEGDRSYFEAVDWRGKPHLAIDAVDWLLERRGLDPKLVANLDPQRMWSADQPFLEEFSWRNDFHVAQDAFYVVSEKKGFVRDPKAWFEAPSEHEAGSVVRFDLAKKRHAVAWNAFSHFTPLASEKGQRRRKFAPVTSLVKSQEGFLLALRNQGQVIEVDEEMKRILRRFEGAKLGFANPTYAELSPEGLLLVSESGGAEGCRVVLVELRTGKTVLDYRPTPALDCRSRGNATMLPNGNVLASFIAPRPAARPNDVPVFDLIVEIDRTGREVARLEVPLPGRSAGDRVYPLASWGPGVPIDPKATR